MSELMVSIGLDDKEFQRGMKKLPGQAKQTARDIAKKLAEEKA